MTLSEFLKTVDAKEEEIIDYNNMSESELISLVKKNGYLIRHLSPSSQSITICLVAVNQNPDALQYVWNQVDEVCKKALEGDGHALRFVRCQTEDICFVAMNQNGDALQYVINKTRKICLAACLNNHYAVQYIPKGVFDA